MKRGADVDAKRSNARSLKTSALEIFEHICEENFLVLLRFPRRERAPQWNALW